MSQVGDQAAWSAVVPDLVFNPEAGIAAFWVSLKAAGRFIGVPVTGEIQTGDGGVEQAFSSGAVIRWHQDEGTSLQ